MTQTLKQNKALVPIQSGESIAGSGKKNGIDNRASAAPETSSTRRSDA